MKLGWRERDNVMAGEYVRIILCLMESLWVWSSFYEELLEKLYGKVFSNARATTQGC